MPSKDLHSTNARKNHKRTRRTRFLFELLEQRAMLASDLHATSIPFHWFESNHSVDRVPVAELARVDKLLPEGVAGPVAPALGEWIVQLTDDSANSVNSFEQAAKALNQDANTFTIICGLGSKGSLLVRGTGSTKVSIEASLSHNSNVQSFSLNQLIQGQSTTPNDPEFVAGLMPGMEKIDATNAWDVTRGSSSTVVGVVDGGIDPTHPDLYLNIWINQGELTNKYLDDVGPKLTDIDGDGLITFYDLNNVTRATTAPYALTFNGYTTGPNASFVADKNNNGRIDAIDLLEDPNWADGFDTDNNGFFDDFFGVNFRVGSGDPFAANNPSDELGHGTHVAGTIGAIGGNATGVVGVNWQTSLMSLRILDNNNQGDSGAAIRAINYAREMREQYRVDTIGRVTQGANVRVLNNSWGQPGGYEVSLEAAIHDSSDAGIIFVAAAGNGNFIGQGVDNDRTPFYPASYDVPGLIAVAASDPTDRPAGFTNFGAQSVDLFAPGVGIRSTLPGGGYGSANGTSMATPHVAGTAALVWSAFPEATVAEVQKAILSKVAPIANGSLFASTGGRLSASKAIIADVFAPAARLIAKQNITTAGGTSTEFTVQYFHRKGINAATIGNDDILVKRQWGSTGPLSVTLKPNSITSTSTSVNATYILTAPGGVWDPEDFGDYVVETTAGGVVSSETGQSTQSREIGLFNVRINDPSFIYVQSNFDKPGNGSLREAIATANAAGAFRTIILETGTYLLEIPFQADPNSTFPQSISSTLVDLPPNLGAWSGEGTGDFDITGSVRIIGNQNDLTTIDAQRLDRVFKVHAGGFLELDRVTIRGGNSPPNQGGGGVLSLGELRLNNTIVRGNRALGNDPIDLIGGGGIATWGGGVQLSESWIDGNEADFGGAFFATGDADFFIDRSTISNNQGGGVHSHSHFTNTIVNSTFSENVGGKGAIFNSRNSFEGNSFAPVISADGRFVAFESESGTLVPGDTNSVSDIFVYERATGRIERVSVASDGTQADSFSFEPSISADGRFIAYRSHASNLVPADTNGSRDIFVFDRLTRQTTRVSVSSTGAQVPAGSRTEQPAISADGRYVAFWSNANNLVSNDTNGNVDVFVRDLLNQTTERVSLTSGNFQISGDSLGVSISDDGRFVTFTTDANNVVSGDTDSIISVFLRDRSANSTLRVADGEKPQLSGNGRFIAFQSSSPLVVSGDTNNTSDVFVYDIANFSLERISKSAAGTQGNGGSSDPKLSRDGKYVVFNSAANNLVSADLNDASDLFIRNRTTNSVFRIPSGSGSSGPGFGFSQPSIDAEGRFIAFDSSLDSLLFPDNNQLADIYLYDAFNQTASAVTVFSSGALQVEQVSVVDASQANYAVTGKVILTDALLVNAIFDRSPGVTSTNVISKSDAGAFAIGPLKRRNYLPPVRPLLAGNPAIDKGTPSFQGRVDQWGRIRTTPDIGAFEAIEASISGTVYVDLNQNQLRESDEPVISDAFVSVNSVSLADSNSLGGYAIDDLSRGKTIVGIQPPGLFQSSKAKLQIIPPLAANNTRGTNGASSADGRFFAFESDADNLVPADTNGNSDVFLFDRLRNTTIRVNTSLSGSQANDQAFSPVMSTDGRFIAYLSRASNLVLGDTSSVMDVFLFDRETSSTQRINLGPNGVEANQDTISIAMSANGRFIAYNSLASNIAAGDTNDKYDFFVFDRVNRTTEYIPTSLTSQNFFISGDLKISGDGRYLTFSSNAGTIVSGDTNNNFDIFVYDRVTKAFDRVSVNSTGGQVNGDSLYPDLSFDGRYVVYQSSAVDIVSGDNNDSQDVFWFDRITREVKLLSKANNGSQALDFSFEANISGDGRFVAFSSFASNLIPDDTNGNPDVFVVDLTTNQLVRASNTVDGKQAISAGSGNGSSSPKLSVDGQFLTFLSSASNLVPGDSNQGPDGFFVANPLADGARQLTLVPGDQIVDLDFPLIAQAGNLSGRLFVDTVLNSEYDVGEPPIIDAVVFLDLNRDGFASNDEPRSRTDAEGRYHFSNAASQLSHVIQVIVPIGFELVTPGREQGFVIERFLPAGGSLTDLDFALKPVQSVAQSSDSAVSGRLYDDRNGNKIYDAVDVPIANREVYLDATNFGVRDANEPRVLTDAQGFYSMSGLSSRTVAVATTLDSSLVHVTPLGSNFTLQKSPLYSSVRPFSNPQAIASGDFNADGLLDVALALSEANKLSIRLNNGLGGFLSTEIDVDLGSNGTGPTSLVVGQFDTDSKLDVALTANFSSKVIVLLNFDPTNRTFGSQSAVNVGLLPIDLVTGQFGGDPKLDLAIVNQGSSTVASTVQLLTNNGNGVFTAGPPIATGGKTSVSLVAGNFAGDPSTDIAIVNASPLTTNTPNGGVTVLRGNGAGGLSLEPSYYQVGAVPIDSVTADFNGDARPDMAVANFSSNSISILLGQANGTFRVQTAILGTASGAFDITVGDIDNDGDMDVIASNLVDRNISIFRNVGVNPSNGDVLFEPLENVGLGQFSLAQRMPLVVGNFDNDRSGPGGTGTLDIVTIPQRTDTLHVLNNKLVNGSRRVALTGTNSVSGLDFIIKSAILSPSFDEIANPSPIVEDATEQTIQIGGIKKGRATGPSLRFTAKSSNPSLVASPSISFVDGSASASIRYTTLQNANSTSVISVRAVEAGANQIFDDGDDGIFERSFTVTVLAVNDAPSMTTPTELAVSQKAGSKTVSNFVTGISTGGGSDEQNQVLSAFTVTADASFFVVQPSISSTGTLSFTPSPNKSGNVFVTVKLTDNGGVSNGGVDSTTNNFVINILPVNDPPSFQLTGSTSLQAVNGPNTLIGFTTGFSPGGGEDELSQVVSDYLVSVDSPWLFAVLPSISNDGTLRFTPATDRNGIATVTVRVRDNGGTLNGGVDMSSSQNFSITVGTAQSLTLNATELGPHEIAIRNGLLVVTARGASIRSVPLAELTKVTTIDGSGGKLFEVALPASNLLGMVRFTGVSNPIELIAERSAVDLSILTSDKLFGIGLVDLRAVGANSLAFQASNINAINGSKKLRILMDREDSLSIPGNWLAQTGRLENGVWVQPFTNAGAKIEVISETPWQNKVNRFDIDGDQAVSPLDALVLVNLINANTFPNGQLPARGSTQPDGFFDPDGDNLLGPLDVLSLINEINRGSGAGSEGEGEERSDWVDQVMVLEFGDLEAISSNFSKRKLENRR